MVVRVVSLFLAFALWMVPQMLTAKGAQILCDEYGVPMPIPAGEEEEVKHTKLPPAVLSGSDNAYDPARSIVGPMGFDHPLDAGHCDVPYPPPRSVA